MTLAEEITRASSATDHQSDTPRRTYVGKKALDGGWPGIIRCIEESRTGSFSRVLRPKRVAGIEDEYELAFTWGYGGSGPAATAHAILSDFLEVDVVPAVYQRFKFEVVAQWSPSEGWTLPDHAIKEWLDGCGIPKEDWAVREP